MCHVGECDSLLTSWWVCAAAWRLEHQVHKDCEGNLDVLPNSWWNCCILSPTPLTGSVVEWFKTSARHYQIVAYLTQRNTGGHSQYWWTVEHHLLNKIHLLHISKDLKSESQIRFVWVGLADARIAFVWFVMVSNGFIIDTLLPMRDLNAYSSQIAAGQLWISYYCPWKMDICASHHFFFINPEKGRTIVKNNQVSFFFVVVVFSHRQANNMYYWKKCVIC